ncbi:hypothetical protein JAAARDRAFT_37656 [Jaapia argillacea MUCL 33604]|uniref:Uncharacterized protein n=1 Tax=Jaapia argillacea MUCL 33604 TaxID=933084 RepID=A0A067PXR8_9AGAM|nr:hypothetical protein JAAARDRAFT_37656 [Jaapia argillacea MUCL 33604]
MSRRSMRILENEMQRFDFSDTGKLKDVCHLTTKAISSNPKRHALAPLFLIKFAIRNFVNPTLLLEYIPQLLDLLAYVERVRKTAESRAVDVLVWQDYYTRNPSEGTIVLNEEELARVEEWSGKGETGQRAAARARKIWSSLVFGLCELHIHYSWTVRDQPTLFEDYMKKYFPFLPEHRTNKTDDTFDDRNLPPDVASFHHLLTDAEETELHDSEGERCVEFIGDVSEWEDAFQEDWLDQLRPTGDREEAKEALFEDPDFVQAYQESFETEFPWPIDLERPRGLVEYYLEKAVTPMIEGLMSIFPSSD